MRKRLANGASRGDVGTDMPSAYPVSADKGTGEHLGSELDNVFTFEIGLQRQAGPGLFEAGPSCSDSSCGELLSLSLERLDFISCEVPSA